MRRRGVALLPGVLLGLVLVFSAASHGASENAEGLIPHERVDLPPEKRLVTEASRLIEAKQSSPLDRKEAFRKLQEAIGLNPNYAYAYYVLARYHAIDGFVHHHHLSVDVYRPGSLDNAIAAIENATRITPDYAEAHVYAGYLYAHAREYAKARDALDLARSFSPNDDWLDINQAELDWLERRLDKAKELLSHYLSREGGDKKARWYAQRLMLRVSCALGDAALAKETFYRFRKDFPADAYVQINYAYNLIYHLGDFDEAAIVAREAVGMRDSSEARHTLALALYGKWATVVTQNPADPAAAVMLAEAESLYPLMFTGSHSAWQGPGLKVAANALKTHGLYDEAESQPRRFARHLWRHGFRESGISEWTWQQWTLRGLLAAGGWLLWRRMRARRAARPRTSPVIERPLSPEPAQAITFTGSGSEYFRIWIVNLLLTILTLGIYSAWAKVRKLKYFYRNTELAGARFDYHGDPLAILKGRVVAVALLLGYQYLFDISTATGIATAVLLAVAMPWLLRNSFRFRLRYSSYRGIRFGFKGSLQHAYYVFLLGWAGSLVSAGALAPFFHQRLKRYQHGNAYLGQTGFSFDCSLRAFYRVYLTGFAVFLVFPLVAVAAIAGYAFIAKDYDPQASATMSPMLLYALLAVYGVTVLLIAPYFNARLQNLIWNNTRLGQHGFISRLSAQKLGWIYFSNLLGVILTLGFFMPWASVRLARYKAQSLSFSSAGDISAMTAETAESVGAAGQEVAEFFDIDISL